MNNTQTVPRGTIESNGLLATLKTLGLTIAGFAITAILASIYHFNYGSYQALAMVAFPPLLHFIVLFFSKYDIQVQEPAASQDGVPQV